MPAYDPQLRPLLAFLAQTAPTTPTTWQGWCITPITGGANNLLYWTMREDADFAIKFTIRDQRDRAGREWAALSALAQAGVPIAPRPILLDPTTYRLPVIVQTWLAGQRLTLPTSDHQWLALMQHFATIHAVAQAHTTIALRLAWLNAQSVPACRTLVTEQLNHLPPAHQAPALRKLVERLADALPHDWPPPALRLCRVDPNVSNFIQRPSGIASVDWENSGWGDPAFEIADLLTHPVYRAVPVSRWSWIMQTYSTLMGDATAPIRIGAYAKTMLVWWVIRFARMLYEIPQGLDQRLVVWPQNWEQDIRAKYDDYVARMEASDYVKWR